MFDLLTPTSKLGVVVHIHNPSIEEADRLIPGALCLASGEFLQVQLSDLVSTK